MFTCVTIGAEMLLLFLLQSTVFTSLQIAGGIPNLLMMLCSATGYQFGKLPGMVCGFFCGLMLDFAGDGIIGVNALIFLWIGYLNGFLHKYYVKNDVFVPLALTAASELIYCFFMYVFNFLIRGRLSVLSYLKTNILPTLIYTVVLSVVVYRLLDLVYNGVILRSVKHGEESEKN